MAQLRARSADPQYVNIKRADTECWARAWEYLRSLLGAAPDDLCWDGTHHLQGHAHVAGHELVVIAPRDEEHHVLVLTPADWDEIRRARPDERGELLRRCAIADHDRLVRVLAAA
jgi:hypothetical protein